MVTTVGEAIAIITLLHFGGGLFAMAMIMAASELIYVLCCFVASRRILPEIRIGTASFTTSVFRELIRFAGSYQLVNVLEVLYGMLLPVIVLKYFGAEVAGVFAVATRLVTAVLMGQDALILPLLSGDPRLRLGFSREVSAIFPEIVQDNRSRHACSSCLCRSLWYALSFCMDRSNEPSVWLGDLAHVPVQFL